MKKLLFSICLIPSLIFSECDFPYDGCEISQMIYEEYMDSCEARKFETNKDDLIWLMGYSAACLNLYYRINLID